MVRGPAEELASAADVFVGKRAVMLVSARSWNGRAETRTGRMAVKAARSVA